MQYLLLFAMLFTSCNAFYSSSNSMSVPMLVKLYVINRRSGGYHCDSILLIKLFVSFMSVDCFHSVGIRK